VIVIIHPASIILWMGTIVLACFPQLVQIWLKPSNKRPHIYLYRVFTTFTLRENRKLFIIIKPFANRIMKSQLLFF